ncbi:penicillin-binding protein [Raoultibacter phocaeensis]|uniref:penicillin-binding protein n=1 Tax=Raoultibacter phocaeensis TaxID=2479841 RepID=UPI00111A0238|nr:penicillin-binding protein [Raoultibacter phocaeensis]
MKNRRKQREVRSHATGWSFVIAFIAVSFVVYGAVQGALGVMNSWLEELPSIEDSDAFNFAEKTRVYASDGTTLLAEFFVENREPVSLDQISPYVLEGTVDTEDVRFYEHNGVDPQGIARALVNNMRGGALEGASTITQQFVRNTLLADEATEISFERKIREAELATQLEKQYSKDEILLMYLNTINYGDGCYGIETAAKNYFQKPAADLTLVEAATLVGIPQSPTYLNPKTNPDACLDRRNTVLSRMLSAGSITKEEYDEAIAQELVLDPAPPRASDGIYAYPYFTSYVRQLLLEEYSQAEVFKGGLTVYTTIDPGIQAKAELACENQYARMAEEDEVSLTCIDPNTGYILAMVGGKNYEEEEWNLATQGGRPAGSSFKPFTLTAAIEQGINPSTLIDCTSPYKVGNDRFENYGNINYGIRSIQSATAVSSNTGFIRLVQEVTPHNAVEAAYRLGITTEQPEVLTSTLGVGNVTSLEMASAYGTFATGGIRHQPEAITQILDRNGNEIDASNPEGERVISEEVAYAVTKVLKTVFTQGDGTAAGYMPYSGQPVAGKTGTSDDFKDHWLVGYTPHLSCAIWIGNPDYLQPGNQYLSCNAIWQDFMNMALEGYEYQDFTPAADPAYGNKFNKEQNDKLYKETEEGKKEEAEKKKKEEEEKAKKEKEEADKKKQEEEANKPVDPPPPASPPNVVGMTLDQASGALAGFSAEYVEEYHATVPKGIVISQEVVGGKVRLHVSLGPAPGG